MEIISDIAWCDRFGKDFTIRQCHSPGSAAPTLVLKPISKKNPGLPAIWRNSDNFFPLMPSNILFHIMTIITSPKQIYPGPDIILKKTFQYNDERNMRTSG